VQKVLDKIDPSNDVGLRDRALLGTLAYTFARIGAVVNLKVEDYFQTGKRSLIRFNTVSPPRAIFAGRGRSKLKKKPNKV
jgi:integrase